MGPVTIVTSIKSGPNPQILLFWKYFLGRINYHKIKKGEGNNGELSPSHCPKCIDPVRYASTMCLAPTTEPFPTNILQQSWKVNTLPQIYKWGNRQDREMKKTPNYSRIHDGRARKETKNKEGPVGSGPEANSRRQDKTGIQLRAGQVWAPLWGPCPVVGETDSNNHTNPELHISATTEHP